MAHNLDECCQDLLDEKLAKTKCDTNFPFNLYLDGTAPNHGLVRPNMNIDISSELLNKVKDFLPKIAKANEDLKCGEDHDIETLTNPNCAIEMDFQIVELGESSDIEESINDIDIFNCNNSTAKTDDQLNNPLIVECDLEN